MLTFLPTPIGNIEDITIRAVGVLEKADVLLCEDTRVAKRLLQLLSERFSKTFRVKRFISLHSHNEAEFIADLTPDFFDQNVVYMSDAGMPCISDPGAVLARWCRQNGVAYTVLPGPSAFSTAYAASGFGATRFLFFGFLPHKGDARRQALAEALRQPWPVVLYEAPHRLEKLLKELEQEAPKRSLFLAKEISKRYERYYFGTAQSLLETLQEQGIRGEWAVVLDGVTPDEGDAEAALAEVLSSDMPPRKKAKAMAKLTGKSVKECYRELTKTVE